MVERMNEGDNVVTSMHINNNEDPSTSMDTLVST